ncbi:MAG: tetratricopeptide repeat protein [Acidobacteria bacterium]|nr:tetratricopeptide repeat protein [Acidobacteriota bacterium]
MRRWKSDSLFLLFAIGLAMSLLSSPYAHASASSKNQQGNQLYKEKKYPEALKRYTEAQLEAPDSPQLHYNLGNVFFRQGEVEKAREEYRRALAAADASLDPRAVYNLGNTFLSQQQYQEAVEAYQRTLKLAPKDMDAKRNLELALLAMKQQKQQQNSSGKDSKHDQQQKDDEPKPTPSGSDEKKDKQGQQEEKKEDQRNKGQGERHQKGSLTKEEAERILSALQEDEKANMKRRLEAQQQEQASVNVDW